MTLPRQHAHSLFSWLKNGLNAGTLITVLAIAGGFVAARARSETRLDDLERRVTSVEITSVKRSEAEGKDKFMADALGSINQRLGNIERTLMRTAN